jgi:hypothetical protein
MTPQQIVGLASRLFAIWLALSGIAQATAMMLALIGSKLLHGMDWIGYFPYFTVLIYLGSALLLWFFPMWIAHKLVPRTKFTDKLRLPAQQVVVVACVVLGLAVIVLLALPFLSRYIFVAAVLIGEGQTLSSMGITQHINGFIGTVQLIAGIVLMTKAHAISGRFIGTPEEIKDACADDS